MYVQQLAVCVVSVCVPLAGNECRSSSGIRATPLWLVFRDNESYMLADSQASGADAQIHVVAGKILLASSCKLHCGDNEAIKYASHLAVRP